METKYSVIQEKQAEHPVRRLIRFSGDRNFIASLSAFGPGTYEDNQAEMQKKYSHPKTGEIISFKPATTAETILINTYDFENRAKPEILDPKWLQVGRIVRTSEGVFVNPPNFVLYPDEKTLKCYLNGVKPIKVNKGQIYIVPNSISLKDFGFASYETFTRGVQDCDTFAHSGLARILEHTKEKIAENLKEIASPKFYKRGVNVWGFDDVKEPILSIMGLGSSRDLGVKLDVIGNSWSVYLGSYASGVLDSSKASAKNK